MTAAHISLLSFNRFLAGGKPGIFPETAFRPFIFNPLMPPVVAANRTFRPGARLDFWPADAMMITRILVFANVMHEFSIMQAALETAGEKTRAAGATQIHRLTLRVGALSGVVPAALRFAFDALKGESPAATAELEIENVPAVGWCAGCAAEFDVAEINYECPRCHQPSGELRRGREMDLASLEIS
jgi:hydrogenase nickel incorporation protein HypA/HybF